MPKPSNNIRDDKSPLASFVGRRNARAPVDNPILHRFPGFTQYGAQLASIHMVRLRNGPEFLRLQPR